MHKIRSLARRSSGRVNAPPARRVSSRQEKRASNSSARKQPQSEAAPEADVGRAHSSAGTNLNALALFGKKIFGSHHHRHHHHHQPSVGTAEVATTPTPRRVRHGHKYPSLDLMGAYASRRPRRGNQMNTLSGGTSLMDIQAFVHANRAKTDVRWCDEGSDVFLESNGRRASETVRGRESSVSLLPLDGEMPPEDVEVAGSTSLQAAAGVGRCQEEEDREGRKYSIESSPPTPPLPRRSFKTSAPLPPRRHQKKGSNGSLTRSTSLKVGQKIVNHKDLDLVVQRGDYARRCRRTGAPTMKSRNYRRGGNSVALPPPPMCPLVADVFAVEDTVRRNREAALEVLMGRICQDKKEVVEVVKIEDVQRMGATPVGGELEDFDGEDVVLGTIRARTSLSELADFFLQVSSAMDAIYAGESYASIKYRTENKSVHLNAPAVTGHENPSDGELSRFTSQIFGRFPLPPTAPEVPKKRGSFEAGFPFRFSLSEFKKQEKRTLPVSEGTSIRPGRPWKFKDLEKLPCIEPADRIAGVVRWVADVQEALDLDAVQDIAHTIRAPPPYVPYWHAT